MCTYSLVPITLAPATKQGAFIGIRSTTLLRLLIHTIITHRITFYRNTTHKNLLTSSRLLKNIQHLVSKRPNLNLTDLRLNSWWRMTGSNRRPPACKAGALPAELIPLIGHANNLVGLVGLEPTTPALSTRCSNQLSYSPKCCSS